MGHCLIKDVITTGHFFLKYRTKAPLHTLVISLFMFGGWGKRSHQRAGQYGRPPAGDCFKRTGRTMSNVYERENDRWNDIEWWWMMTIEMFMALSAAYVLSIFLHLLQLLDYTLILWQAKMFSLWSFWSELLNAPPSQEHLLQEATWVGHLFRSLSLAWSQHNSKAWGCSCGCWPQCLRWILDPVCCGKGLLTWFHRFSAVRWITVSRSFTASQGFKIWQCFLMYLNVHAGELSACFLKNVPSWSLLGAFGLGLDLSLRLLQKLPDQNVIS